MRFCDIIDRESKHMSFAFPLYFDSYVDLHLPQTTNKKSKQRINALKLFTRHKLPGK